VTFEKYNLRPITGFDIIKCFTEKTDSEKIKELEEKNKRLQLEVKTLKSNIHNEVD